MVTFYTAGSKTRVVPDSDPSTQRQRDLELYRLDGRNFEISEEGDVLSLRLRSSVGCERILTAGMLAFASLLYLLASFWVTTNWLRPLDTLSRLGIESVMVAPFALILGLSVGLFGLRKEAWRIERAEGQISFSGYATLTIPIKEIRRVKATHRGRKYRLYLVAKTGGKVQIGRFGFSILERAWRDDAERIAVFLALPLEISNS
jgi:hypothetical protein